VEDEIQQQSKTQKKKEAEELQRLGLQLGNLSVQQLESVEIPNDLKTALIEGKSITSHIAGRRHRQFIGTLMRHVDPEAISLALLQAEDLIESKPVKESQVWIDKLLAGGQTEMEALLCEFPGLERQRLRQLVRNIKKEKGTKSIKFRGALEKLIMVEINLK
jgi:ribosome-associated protein